MTVMSSALNSALTKGMIALAGAGTYATATGAVLEGAALYGVKQLQNDSGKPSTLKTIAKVALLALSVTGAIAVTGGAALGVFGGLTGGLSLMGGTALSETMATYVLGAGIAIAVLGTSYGHVKAFQWALNTIPKQL